MKHLYLFLLTVVMMLIGGCNLSSQPPTAQSIVTPTSSLGGKPTVIINSPANNTEVAVGAQLFVTATATDRVGITRVQLLANNQIVKTVSSEAPAGQQNFQVLLDYIPRQEGSNLLQVVAYRGAIASDPAVVTIIARTPQPFITPTAPTSGGGGFNPPVIDPNDPTCRALTLVALNLRRGPSTNYDRILTLPAGTFARIVGRLGDNSWWQVLYGTSTGWISAAPQYSAVYGICTNVPVVQPPPSPTPPGGVPTSTPVPTSTRVPPSATPGVPDLIISSISGPSTAAAGPNPVTYTVTITNSGQGPSGRFANTIRMPDGTNQEIGVVSNLNAGESISLSVQVTFSTAGQIVLQAMADSNSEVSEASEANNYGFLPVTVNAT